MPKTTRVLQGQIEHIFVHYNIHTDNVSYQAVPFINSFIHLYNKYSLK